MTPTAAADDAYCGCGTTVAVAERLKRRWMGVDITYQSSALILRRLEAQYGKGALANITFNGVPRDMEAANALALKKDDRVRKEFEKWAVLTYSHNRAAINDKKGGDGGIDGVAYFLTGKDDNAKIVFQVKSGNVGRGDIAKLNSDWQREAAELAVFLTLKEPTKGMTDEANGMGLYTHPLMGKHYPRVLIVTIADMQSCLILSISFFSQPGKATRCQQTRYGRPLSGWRFASTSISARGFLNKVYENALRFELEQAGLRVQQQ